MLVKTSSLGVQDDISDKDRREIERLMNDEVLETAKFPEIVFDAPDISVTKMSDMLYSATLNGELDLHGVTRKVTGSPRGSRCWGVCYGRREISR